MWISPRKSVSGPKWTPVKLRGPSWKSGATPPKSSMPSHQKMTSVTPMMTPMMMTLTMMTPLRTPLFPQILRPPLQSEGARPDQLNLHSYMNVKKWILLLGGSEVLIISKLLHNFFAVSMQKQVGYMYAKIGYSLSLT